MFTRFCQLPWLHRWIDHVLLVEHFTLQKTQWLAIMSLQEKAKAAFNWSWESSCSALSNKVYSDQDFYFSAILVMRNKV